MTTDGESSELGMDARLWGVLQNHVDLRMIYAKLPIEDFFRLRAVCKEWNWLASDRKFLEESFKDPIPKPYFLVDSRKRDHRLLTYDATSRRWNWTRLPPPKTSPASVTLNDVDSTTPSLSYVDRCYLQKCEAAGLVYVYDHVFNVHTRVFHALPSFTLEEDEWHEYPLIGMTVETSVSPYSFQVILADVCMGTRIYDSKSDCWTHKPSTVNAAGAVGGEKSDQTCAHCNGFLYSRVWFKYNESTYLQTHFYNLEKDVWDCIVTLPDEELEPTYDHGYFKDHPDIEALLTYDIGAWQDRLFLFGMKVRPTCTITAWELCNHSEEYWTLFDRMPEDLCTWMLAGEEDILSGDRDTIEMRTRFCGEYVLVYTCVGLEDVAERAVLYNLDQKAWEIVEVPGPRRLVSSRAARAEKNLQAAVLKRRYDDMVDFTCSREH